MSGYVGSLRQAPFSRTPGPNESALQLQLWLQERKTLSFWLVWGSTLVL